MLFMYTAAVDREKHTKYIDTCCRQNASGFEILITVLIKITFFLDMRLSGFCTYAPKFQASVLLTNSRSPCTSGRYFLDYTEHGKSTLRSHVPVYKA
jgi:hypothetical protein